MSDLHEASFKHIEEHARYHPIWIDGEEYDLYVVLFNGGVLASADTCELRKLVEERMEEAYALRPREGRPA